MRNWVAKGSGIVVKHVNAVTGVEGPPDMGGGSIDTPRGVLL